MMIVQVLLWALPWPLRRWLLCALFGYEIAPSARIGFSIVGAKTLRMRDKAYIGHLTVVRNLRLVEVGEASHIGNLNFISCTPDGVDTHFLQESGRNPSLVIGAHASITHRHLIDCTDMVTIGAYATLAGWGSQILTHSIDLEACRQSCAPVTIGRYAFIGSRVIILKGVDFPERSVLAAGSVCTQSLREPDCLYGGMPAAFIKKTGSKDKYFCRETGFVN